MRQVILDTETTGLSPEQGHKIIEIGALEMVNRRLTGKQFHYYIHPEREIDPGAQRIHGITLEFLQDKPRFAEIVQELIAFIQGAELIIHNAPFDISFMDAEFKHAGIHQRVSSCIHGVIDTLVIARKQHPGKKNNLDALCKRYAIDNSGRALHGALLDSEILAEVYLAMTGGQETLSWSGTSTQNTGFVAAGTASFTSNRESVVVNDIPVIYANEEELKAHQDYIESLNKN